MPGRARCTIDGPVATVTLSNPGRRNAVGYELFTDLAAIVRALERTGDVHAVIVTGDGADFSVGADLSAALETRTLRRDSVAADSARLGEVSRTVLALHRLPQVTIAAIGGACAGAGLSLAMAADFRIAADNAVFNTAFLDVALSGDLGGVWFLTHALGGARARDLLLDPRRIGAREAHRCGLVHSVTPAGAHLAAADALANRVAARGPLAIRAIKQNLLQAQTATLEDYLPHEIERMVACFHSDDAQEAGRAFLDRRSPSFAGR